MKRTAAALLSIALIFAIAACGADHGPRLPEPLAPSAGAVPADTPEPTPEPEPSTVTLTLAGDLVMHTPLNAEAALPGGGYDFSVLFEDVAHYVSGADYALCCLESPLTGGEPSGYPLFSSPDDLAYSLKDVGFDLINMASNHSVDGFKGGVLRTLDVLDAAGLDHVGTYRSPEERAENNGILVKEINGISIAFLDYTYGTNGIPIDGYEYAVNVYNNDYMTTLVDVNYELLDADMAAARALGADVIAVSVHWGAEYMTSPNVYQQDLADYFFAQGADLVIGGHPHVPQPMEIREIDNGDGTTRKGFLCYCLGNLLSCQSRQYTDLTAMVRLELSKDPVSGVTEISACEYIPMIMINLPSYGVARSPEGWQRRLWDLRAAISDYEAGDDRGVITPYMYNCLVQALADCERIFGTELLAGESEDTP